MGDTPPCSICTHKKLRKPTHLDLGLVEIYPPSPLGCRSHRHRATHSALVLRHGTPSRPKGLNAFWRSPKPTSTTLSSSPNWPRSLENTAWPSSPSVVSSWPNSKVNLTKSPTQPTSAAAICTRNFPGGEAVKLMASSTSAPVVHHSRRYFCAPLVCQNRPRPVLTQKLTFSTHLTINFFSFSLRVRAQDRDSSVFIRRMCHGIGNPNA